MCESLNRAEKNGEIKHADILLDVMIIPDGRLNALRSSCGILLAQAPRWSTGPGLTIVMRTSSQRCGIYIVITASTSVIIKIS